ncbi:MAG: hypothetical protein NZM29_03990, partial [Nitrospira sp.]|nr:hypothetical protein [Nitrospira sp.]
MMERIARIVNVYHIGARVGIGVAIFVLASGTDCPRAWSERLPLGQLVQMPYEAPPAAQDAPDVSVPPNTEPLSPEEIKRAEALLPLLEGKQEFWAMGEFVHLGE